MNGKGLLYSFEYKVRATTAQAVVGCHTAGFLVIDLVETSQELVDHLLNDAPAILQADQASDLSKDFFCLMLCHQIPESLKSLVGAFFACLQLFQAPRYIVVNPCHPDDYVHGEFPWSLHQRWGQVGLWMIQCLKFWKF